MYVFAEDFGAWIARRHHRVKLAGAVIRAFKSRSRRNDEGAEPLTEENGRLPSTYVIIYSLRNREEVAVAEKLIQAAVKYMLGNAKR